jgi:hypothetical protein
MASFAQLWKADKLSDVDVAIRVDGSTEDILCHSGTPGHTKLQPLLLGAGEVSR